MKKLALLAVLAAVLMPLSAFADTIYLPVVGVRFESGVSPEGPQELISNGDFTDASRSWATAGAVSFTSLVPDGEQIAVMGDSEAILAQDVYLPRDAGLPTVSFRVAIPGDTTDAVGTLTALVISPWPGYQVEFLATYDAATMGNDWYTFSLTNLWSYLGSVVRLQFQTSPDCSAQFLVDSASMTIPAQ